MTAAASAVIGAGYGDEGKGLMVDALSSRALERPVVVRSNGGAQAGHTVTLADGRRHVFHHIGSGALAGAATHLSRFFVHHPMVLQAEMDALAALGGALDISADPRGRVTTPWDMLINQAVERVRDGARHGSCGLGFGETIERSLEAPFRLTVGDLARPDLRQRLDAIRLTWTPRRLQALGLARLSAQEAAILADDAILDVFIDDCRRFMDAITVVADADVAALGPVIFEGAQGLQLDQAIGAFPHVTRSHTGLVNMAVIAREAGLDSLDAVYVTRAYATRHGAGPIAHAVDRLEGFDVVDPTNVPNAWQGRMRYAPLDLDILAGGIAADLALTDAGALRLRTGVAVTCLDQARGPIAMIGGGVRREASPCELATLLGARIDQPVNAQGWGPARAGVHFHQAADGRAAWTGVSRHARRN